MLEQPQRWSHYRTPTQISRDITNVPKSSFPNYTHSNRAWIYAENLKTHQNHKREILQKVKTKMPQAAPISPIKCTISMALHLRALGAPFLLFLVIIAPSVPHVHANFNPSWQRAAHRILGGRNMLLKQEQHRPKFQPGPWKPAHATFYDGNSATYGIINEQC